MFASNKICESWQATMQFDYLYYTTFCWPFKKMLIFHMAPFKTMLNGQGTSEKKKKKNKSSPADGPLPVINGVMGPLQVGSQPQLQIYKAIYRGDNATPIYNW